jgi:ubiquinone/menaquinone biosynthesis C-methylase UbiE
MPNSPKPMNKISAVCPWAQEGPRQLDWEDPVIVAALNRYDFAASWAQGKHCLDIGCAVGYGTGRLAEVAANVVGIDYSTDALSEAKKNFSEIRFTQADCRFLPFPDGCFDCITAFEILEHVSETEQTLKEWARVLKTNGRLVLSVPNGPVEQLTLRDIGANPYHLVFFNHRSLRRILAGYFSHVQLFGQRTEGTWFKTWLRAMDVFNLRLRLPRRVRELLEGAKASPREQQDLTYHNGMTGGKAPPEKWIIRPSQLRQARVLVAVCRK